MMDYNDISDEALSAYLEGNASPEEIEQILSVKDYDPDIAETLDIVSESIDMFGDFEDDYLDGLADLTATVGTESADTLVNTNVHDLTESFADYGSLTESFDDSSDGSHDADTQGLDSFDGYNDIGNQSTFDINS